MPDDPVPSQPTAEPAGTAAPSAPASAPAVPAEKPQLASFTDALQAQSQEPPAASNTGRQQPKPADSKPTGSSAAQASKPTASPPSPDVDPSPTAAPESPPSAEGEPSATPAETDETDESGKPESTPAGRPSRRGALQIKALETERDTLLARVQALEAQTTIPDDVMQAATAVRLPDAEFERLEEKLKHEDITNDYLTPDEREQYARARQVRDWSQPWYAHARAEAATFAEQQRTALMSQAAEQLAPVLKAREYLSPDVIGRAQSWADVYEHLTDASHDAGRKAERAELQPKLDEATGRISDLEAELSGLRVASAGRGRPLERGGLSGGAFTARPDIRTASASDLFDAAIRDSELRQNGRRQPAGAR